MNRRILHGNNAFAAESDLAARLNTGRNLAFHTALQIFTMASPPNTAVVNGTEIVV